MPFCTSKQGSQDLSPFFIYTKSKTFLGWIVLLPWPDSISLHKGGYTQRFPFTKVGTLKGKNLLPLSVAPFQMGFM